MPVPIATLFHLWHLFVPGDGGLLRFWILRALQVYIDSQANRMAAGIFPRPVEDGVPVTEFAVVAADPVVVLATAAGGHGNGAAVN